jgi:ribose/xylose/arabinose/galactoside ABC-type transport system permease subunit
MTATERAKILLAQNGIFVALLLLIVFFSTLNPRFFSFSNGETVLLQIVELGIIALPIAFIVMTGSVDLSVGSIASLTAVISGMVMNETGSPVVGIVAGLAVGLLTGAINGFLVAYFGLSSMVVTLGALSVWGGLALVITNGATVTGLPESFRALGKAMVGPVPLQLLLLVLAIATAGYLLARHPIGRQVLAVGGNPRASHLIGINVPRVRMLLFIASGASASVAGILLSAKIQAASPTIGSGLEIQALTVVLLGGVAFSGGVGRISSVVAGLLFVGVLRNGLIILGVSPFLQTALIGATLIAGVAMDSSVQRLVNESWAKRGKQAMQATSPVDDSHTPSDEFAQSSAR